MSYFGTHAVPMIPKSRPVHQERSPPLKHTLFYQSCCSARQAKKLGTLITHTSFCGAYTRSSLDMEKTSYAIPHRELGIRFMGNV
jgi:hypothetical protein